ncbi:hypothetical protein [Paraburkholderia sp. CNPSo 3281]|uniref:hypothetical protein n=1 Tax=Paraburkholderia sp. CNPSo 3281 TaxID=2940933 RepID=UPI00265F07A0|nr:hypothetical protein [Paraburkholderia sp. CNPSo 3281]
MDETARSPDALKSCGPEFPNLSYTAKLIEDQQARTIGDVLSNDPAVRTAYGYGNFLRAEYDFLPG